MAEVAILVTAPVSSSMIKTGALLNELIVDMMYQDDMMLMFCNCCVDS